MHTNWLGALLLHLHWVNGTLLSAYHSRPAALQDRNRDSDDEDFRDRDYDVAALANNLSQAFRYGIYSNDNIEEVILWGLDF